MHSDTWLKYPTAKLTCSTINYDNKYPMHSSGMQQVLLEYCGRYRPLMEVLKVLMFGSRTYSELHIAYDLLIYLLLDFKKL